VFYVLDFLLNVFILRNRKQKTNKNFNVVLKTSLGVLRQRRGLSLKYVLVHLQNPVCQVITLVLKNWSLVLLERQILICKRC
jgi:hypothetical protein